MMTCKNYLVTNRIGGDYGRHADVLKGIEYEMDGTQANVNKTDLPKVEQYIKS